MRARNAGLLRFWWLYAAVTLLAAARTKNADLSKEDRRLDLIEAPPRSSGQTASSVRGCLGFPLISQTGPAAQRPSSLARAAAWAVRC